MSLYNGVLLIWFVKNLKCSVLSDDIRRLAPCFINIVFFVKISQLFARF